MLVLSKKQMQNADSYSQKKIGFLEEILMENAGQAFFHEIIKFVNVFDKISVLCGRGNNGGDGIVLARKLKQHGYCVQLILIDDVQKLSKTSAYHLKIYCGYGFEFEKFNEFDDSVFLNANFIVDAVFGVGFHGKVNDFFVNIIKKINESKAKVVSLDLPSGVSADDGNFDVAVKANYTFVVNFLKISFFQFPAKLNYGKVIVVDVGIDCDLETKKNCIKTWEIQNFKSTFIYKKINDNKWNGGKVLLISGSKNMVGASILTSKACLNSGVGLLELAIVNNLKNLMVREVLEATYCNTTEKNGVLCDFDFKQNADVVAIGPGLTKNECVFNVVKKVIEINKPIIIDADALFFLNDDLLNLIKNRKTVTILTPHIVEMARLCKCDVKFVECNKFNLSKQKALEWGCIIVLKGPNTIVSTPNGLQFVNLSGNEGLAQGGTGDVLTGIIAAFVAKFQKMFKTNQMFEAVCNAVFLHGFCADLLVKQGFSTQSINATDVVNCLKVAFKKLKTN